MISSTMKRTVRRATLGLAATGIAGATLAVGASPALAGPPTGAYADFNRCPLSIAAVENCLNSDTLSGQFKLGNAAVPINKKINLQGGYSLNPDTGAAVWYDAPGGKSLQEVALDVPGGLSGLVPPSSIFDIPLLGMLLSQIFSLNTVTATAEQAGPIEFGFINYLINDGTALKLPVKIHLKNPFLGDNCYIGSNSNPVVLNLGTGTTAPPAPNTPITGATGDIEFSPDGNIVTGTGYKLVDNAFKAPAAADCGPWGFRWIVTPVVNLKEGLPAAAGKNTAIMQGNLKTGSAVEARASAH